MNTLTEREAEDIAVLAVVETKKLVSIRTDIKPIDMWARLMKAFEQASSAARNTSSFMTGLLRRLNYAQPTDDWANSMMLIMDPLIDNDDNYRVFRRVIRDARTMIECRARLMEQERKEKSQ